MTKDIEERIERFLDIMGGIADRPVVNILTKMGFFTAPASTMHHGCYEGGLFDHSYNVTKCLLELTEKNDLKWKATSSPRIVGMFHDLCKCDQYRHKIIGVQLNGEDILDPTSYEYRDDILLKGHGSKSVMLLSQLYKLTEEEVCCVRYHMGAFTSKDEWSNYTRAIHKYPNVLWTHTADMLAAHVMEVK